MSKLIIPIYGVRIYGYKGIDDETFKKQLALDTKTKFPPEMIKDLTDDSDRKWLAVVDDLDDEYIVRFRQARPNINTIAHEAFHLTTKIMDYTGVKLHDSSDEAYAYLLGYITQALKELEPYERTKPNRKRKPTSTLSNN